MRNNKTIIITVGILVVLIAVVIALMMTRSTTEGLPNESDNQTDVNSVGGDESNFIIVNDQIPGDVVFYNNLALAEDGFVVVRESDDGNPGDVIGVQAVEAGDNLTGNVDLEESTVEGGEYFIELYIDTNENGTFDEDEDEPVTTDSGSVVRIRINTTEDLPEVKG